MSKSLNAPLQSVFSWLDGSTMPSFKYLRKMHQFGINPIWLMDDDDTTLSGMFTDTESGKRLSQTVNENIARTAEHNPADLLVADFTDEVTV
ncbi:MAG: hypothetical protein JNL32_01170 [Candidatus Kapabacteria bacterium]|nr:hypothetical protein [Candidatus Kapabacteria bacterium]